MSGRGREIKTKEAHTHTLFHSLHSLTICECVCEKEREEKKRERETERDTEGDRQTELAGE